MLFGYHLRNPKQEGGRPSLMRQINRSCQNIIWCFVCSDFFQWAWNLHEKAEIHLPRSRDKAQQFIVDTPGLEIGSDRLSFTCRNLQYPKTVFRRFDPNAKKQCKSTQARCRSPSQDGAHEKLDLSSTAFQPLNDWLWTSPGVSDFLRIVLGWICDEHEFIKTKGFSDLNWS